jgi:hypothetical protein
MSRILKKRLRRSPLSFYQPSILNLLLQKGLHRRKSLEEERSKYTFGRPITTRVINWSINGHYIYAMEVSTLNSHREVTQYLSLYSALHV